MRRTVVDLVLAIVATASLFAVYHLGRFDERQDFEKKVAVFSTRVECPDPDWLYAKSIDLRTGEVKCRYYFKGRRS